MVSSGGQSMLFSNFIVSFFLGTSMQQLWGTINVMSLEFFNGLVDIRHQANVEEFYTILG